MSLRALSETVSSPDGCVPTGFDWTTIVSNYPHNLSRVLTKILWAAALSQSHDLFFFFHNDDELRLTVSTSTTQCQSWRLPVSNSSQVIFQTRVRTSHRSSFLIFVTSHTQWAYALTLDRITTKDVRHTSSASTYFGNQQRRHEDMKCYYLILRQGSGRTVIDGWNCERAGYCIREDDSFPIETDIVQLR